MKPDGVSVCFTSPLETQWMNKPTLGSVMFGLVTQSSSRLCDGSSFTLINSAGKNKNPPKETSCWIRAGTFWSTACNPALNQDLVLVPLPSGLSQSHHQDWPPAAGAPGDHRWNSDHQRLWFHSIRGKITKQLCENTWIELKVHKYSPGVEVTNYHYSDYSPFFGCFLTHA